MLIRRSILSPRDSTCSQRSNSVLPIQLYSKSASTIFVYCTCFWSSHLNFLSYLTFSLHTGVDVLNLHVFTFMFTIPFMAWWTRLIILRLNILCHQRQVIHILFEVHISIIIQVARDISNIETIAQWPSTTWFTCSLRVRGTFLSSFWAQCIANRSAWLKCINYHLKTLIYMFYCTFSYMFRGCI